MVSRESATSARSSSRTSGTGATPMLADDCVAAYAVTSAPAFVSALKTDVLPTLGRPTIPISSDAIGRAAYGCLAGEGADRRLRDRLAGDAEPAVHGGLRSALAEAVDAERDQRHPEGGGQEREVLRCRVVGGDEGPAAPVRRHDGR